MVFSWLPSAKTISEQAVAPLNVQLPMWVIPAPISMAVMVWR